MAVANDLLYKEKLASNRTLALFLALTILFLALAAWRLAAGSPGVLAVVFFCLGGTFLFYSLNYRTLVIRLGPRSLELGFGIFSWTVPLETIAEFRLDQLPWLKRMGGAGIHFMTVRGRYRVSFNFLEHPRVVIALKRKRGLVRDVSFSTRNPDEVLRLIRERTALEARAKK
jgi:hypothetical protein